MANRALTWAGPGPWARPQGCRGVGCDRAAPGAGPGPGPWDPCMSTVFEVREPELRLEDQFKLLTSKLWVDNVSHKSRNAFSVGKVLMHENACPSSDQITHLQKNKIKTT